MTPNRCRFGRPHVWQLGFKSDGTYVGEGGSFAHCATCDALDYEGDWWSE